VVQILRPVMRQPSPSLAARVRTDARSDPESGSLMPRQNVIRPAAIPGRIASRSVRDPLRTMAGPI
jgi:hypothetical protein